MRRAYDLTIALLLISSPVVAQSGLCDNSRTEVARANCLNAAFAHADSELNQVYQRAMRSITDSATRAALLASQRAWVSYRTAQRQLVSLFAGGNHPSEQLNPHLIGLTNDRIAFLKGVLGEAEPGSSTAPPTRDAVYTVLMKSDLRNLVVAEEEYFADSVEYTARIVPGGLDFHVTQGNTVPRITLTADGWTATIGNVSTPIRCTIFIGSTRMAPANKEGEPQCQ